MKIIYSIALVFFGGLAQAMDDQATEQEELMPTTNVEDETWSYYQMVFQVQCASCLNLLFCNCGDDD